MESKLTDHVWTIGVTARILSSDIMKRLVFSRIPAKYRFLPASSVRAARYAAKAA